MHPYNNIAVDSELNESFDINSFDAKIERRKYLKLTTLDDPGII